VVQGSGIGPLLFLIYILSCQQVLDCTDADVYLNSSVAAGLTV